MSQSKEKITPRPEFVDFLPLETFQAMVKYSTPETCEIEILGPDDQSLTEHFNPELATAAGLQTGDQISVTFTHQYRPDAGEFQSLMVIAKDQDTNTQKELQTFGSPDYKVGIVQQIEDDYAQVDITSDNKENAEYFDSGLVILAGIWAGDTVVIENKAEFNSGLIQVTSNVTGNIKTAEQREADNARKVQEAQEIITGLDMEAIGEKFKSILT